MTRIACFIAAALSYAALHLGAARAEEPRLALLAAWFDSDGFYNKPGVSLARATGDLAACRLEALRLKRARNSSSPGVTATAINSDGTYNPGVSAAATGISMILFAIQDARYNGSVERKEFKDCATTLGYRYFRLDENKRKVFDATEDRGFDALVAAPSPAEGRAAEPGNHDNYFLTSLVTRPYTTKPAVPAPDAVPDASSPVQDGFTAPVASVAPLVESSSVGPDGATPTATAPARLTPIARLALGATATGTDGMAVVVVSVRTTGPTAPYAGNDIRFERVTEQGAFNPEASQRTFFVARAHHNNERRRDPTLAGDGKNPRYSTYIIPSGRYALTSFGTLNACLGTVTFDVAPGDVAYLGDWVVQPPGMAMGSLLNPAASVNDALDKGLKDAFRVAVDADLEGARAALQADDTAKGRLALVSWRNGLRIACEGNYIGRVSHPDWPSLDAEQIGVFHDAMVAAASGAEPR